MSTKDRELKVFFVAGAPRSGTTMLRSVFANTSFVAIVPEIRFFDYFFAIRMQPFGLKIVRKLILERAGRVSGKKHWGAFDLNGLEKELLSRRSYREMLLSAMRYMTDKSPYEIIAEKTPTNALFIPRIRKMFPDAKIVFLARDGREVCASACKKWYGNTNRTYLKVAALWVLIARQYRKDVKNIPHLLLRYEDITADPEQWLPKLFEYIGVSETGKAWEDIASTSSFEKERAQKGVHTSSHYYQYFSEEQRMHIEYFLGKPLRLFGYEKREFSSYTVPYSIRLLYRLSYCKQLAGMYIRRMGLLWILVGAKKLIAKNY